MTPSGPPLPPKREVAMALLARGSLFVHCDARVAGVVVPDWLGDRARLVLQVGYDMPVPIPDLRVDEDGLYATLSFNRTPYPCSVPWPAVFALVGDDGSGLVWPESFPPEVASEVEGGLRRRDSERRDGAARASPDGSLPGAAGRPASGTPTGRPSMEVLEGGAPDEPLPPRRPPRRGHLKLVK